MTESTYNPELIKQLEDKMMPSPNGRTKEQSAKTALTRAEQLIYADYLESVRQPLGAAFFRKEDK